MREGRKINEHDFARVRQHLGSYPSTSITPSVCRDYAITTGGSAGTVRKQLTMLRAALRFCAANKQIPNDFGFWLPSQPAPRDRWLSKADIAKLIDALPLPHQRIFVQLALATGARRGAICQIHKSQYANGVLDMRPRQQTNKRRGVVPVIAGSKLDTVIQGAIQRSRSGFLVEHKGKPIVPLTATRFTVAGGEAAGLGKVTPHVLKHTACVHMAQAGVPLEDIADYTATNLQTIHKNYLHYTPERGLRAARALLDII